MNEDEIDVACSTHIGVEKCLQDFRESEWKKPLERRTCRR